MEVCKYASKPCWNSRFVKANGELHRFCLFHRAKANASHRRWQLRRRLPTTTTSPSISGGERAPMKASPPRSVVSKAPIPSMEMRLYRSRVARRQYRQRSEYHLPLVAPLAAHAEIREFSNTNVYAEDLALVQSLSDEEISVLLENIVHVTVDPLNG